MENEKENLNEIKQTTTLLTAQLLNFKTDNNETIKGIQIYSLVAPTENQKENFTNGIVEKVYFATEDCEDTFKKLKRYQEDCNNMKEVCKIECIYEFQSLNKKPKLKKIIFG